MSKIIKFESGLRLYFQQQKATKAVSIGVFVGAGCFYENKQNNGIAHFIEHMLFKGTTTKSAFDIANSMDSLGVHINAFTTKNYTAYYTIGLQDYIPQCMELLSDMYFNSTFTEENMEKEKGVVIEEINMYEDNHEDLCVENLTLAHFGKKEMTGYPILGTINSVKGISRTDILDFMSELYTPENTVISICGNLTEEKVVGLVKEYFDTKMQATNFERKKLKSIKPQGKMVKRIRPIEQANLALGFSGVGLKKKVSAVDSLICVMLCGGMSSRLFQKIREEKGLVYEIYCVANQYYHDGYNEIYFGTSPHKTKEAIVSLKECISNVQEQGFTKEELKKALIQRQTSLVLGAESSTSIMRAGGKMAITSNDCFRINKALKELDKITLERVNERLKEMFDFSTCSISYVGVEPDFDIEKLVKEG